MALTSSGQITFSEINLELGISSTTMISLNDAAVRGLIGKGSGAQFAINELYGASSNSGFIYNLLVDSTEVERGESAWRDRCMVTASKNDGGLYLCTTKKSPNTYGGQGNENNSSSNTGNNYEFQISKMNSDGTLGAIVRIATGLKWAYTRSLQCETESGNDVVFLMFHQLTMNGYTNASNVRRIMKFNSSLVEQAEIKFTAPDPTTNHTEHAVGAPVGHTVSDGTSFYQAYRQYSNLNGTYAGREATAWRKHNISNALLTDSFATYGSGSNWPNGIGRDSSGNIYMSCQDGETANYNHRWMSHSSGKGLNWAKRFTGGGINRWTIQSTAYDSAGNAYSSGHINTSSGNYGGAGTTNDHMAITKINANGTLAWHKVNINANEDSLSGSVYSLNEIAINGSYIIATGYVQRSGRSKYGAYCVCFNLSCVKQWDFCIDKNGDDYHIWQGSVYIDNEDNGYFFVKKQINAYGVDEELTILKVPNLASANGGISFGTYGDYILSDVNYTFSDPPSGYVQTLTNASSWTIATYISLTTASATDIATSSESGAADLTEGM